MKKIAILFWCLALLSVQLAAQTTKTVSGKITDDKGLPLSGATINALGSNNAVVSTAVTDANGNYSIRVTDQVTSIKVAYVGLEEKTVALGGKTALSVQLSNAASNLNEVVVVGYGTQRKKDITGSVSTIKGTVLADKPVQSFEQALGGRAAGVQVNIPNGVLNNPPVIRIRGTNSISLSSYPLIVIDGVPAFTGDQTSVSASGNALAAINPADIESIDIAKDAAASAIYGSRAANGVVFVTTKKGKAGKARVNYDGSANIATVQRLPKLLNAFEYTDIKNEALTNAGIFNANTNSFQLSNGPDGQVINTNWYDYVYRNALSQNHTINVSGANESTNYYFSVGFSKQQGIIRRNDFERKSVLANIETKVSKLLTIGGKMAYSNQLNLAATSSGSLPGSAFATAGLARAALVSAPNVAPYLNNGAYNLAPNGFLGVMNNKQGQVGFYNPVPTLDQNNSSAETNQIQGNVFFQLKPLDFLTLRSVYGIDYSFIDNDAFNSPTTGEGWITGSATSNMNKLKRWVWTNTAQVDFSLGSKNNFSILGGYEQQKTNTSGFGVSRSLISDPFFTNIQGGFGNVADGGTAGNIGENYLSSIFGRLNYNFDKRFYVSANVRQDEASQLGANNKAGTFWGVSGGWEIAKENFFSKAGFDKVFSSLRVRGSYGRLGNISGLSNFGTLSTYGAGLYATNPTLQFTNAGNPNLKWETSTKTDIGLNFGILKERITGEIAYYKNNIDGLILFVTQPPSAGLPNSIATNVGAMYNRGIEFTLNAEIISKKDFSWSANFNISQNDNQVTALAPGLPSLISSTSGLESVSITQPGYAIGTLFVTRTAGIDAATGRRIFVNGAGRNVLFQHIAPAGQSRFMYADGSVAPAVSSADASPFANTNPKYQGGFENTFRFRQFELNAQFTFQTGFYIYYGSRAGLHDQRFWNNEVDILGRWQKTGDAQALFPKVIFGDNVSNGSSFPLDINVFKGDFVKLRNITLSYNFSKELLSRIKINSARFYINGNNLAIITKYPGPDPESQSNGNGTTNQGVDRNQAPNARVITVGLNIGF
jgi:TonB-linked SusC/RagA family outer membrane protein